MKIIDICNEAETEAQASAKLCSQAYLIVS